MTDRAMGRPGGMVRASVRIAWVLGVAVGALPVRAATTSPGTSLSVQTTVPATCTVGVSDVTFAAPTGLNISQTDADGAATVTCTNGATYDVFDRGGSNDPQNGNGVHYLALQGQVGGRPGHAPVLTYQAFSDSARTVPLSNPNGSNVFSSGVGTGSAVSVPVYFRLPQQTATFSGSYTDTYNIWVAF
ncbi:spore coat protein U domain-containing protein [Sphingomonas parapaucimobilis]|uniref:spore coat protein U domain-containing protein n=1 Tax=Sphingomonas parapaucimobilis TaxID=28213 RepID=UPI00391B1A59